MDKIPELEPFDDGAFYVWKTRWGTYASSDKDGNKLVCGLDKDAVIIWSREHLNGFQNSTIISRPKLSNYKL